MGWKRAQDSVVVVSSLPPKAASTVARQSRQALERDGGVYWIASFGGAQVLKLAAVERRGLIGSSRCMDRVNVWASAAWEA